MASGRDRKEDLQRKELKAEVEAILARLEVSKFAVRDVVSFRGDIAYPHDSAEYKAIVEEGKSAAVGKGMSGVAIPKHPALFLAGLKKSTFAKRLNISDLSKIPETTEEITRAKSKALFAEELRDKWMAAAIKAERERELYREVLAERPEEKEVWGKRIEEKSATRKKCLAEARKFEKERDDWLDEVRSEMQDERKVDAVAQPSVSEKISLKLIRQGAKKVEEVRAGECNSFAAFTVAHLLDELKETPPPNIKIVAHPGGYSGTHNFVLLGYDGDDISFDTLQRQQNKFLIVDTWLAALGHGTGVFTVDNYPREKYLHDLICVFDTTRDLVETPSPRSPNFRTF